MTGHGGNEFLKFQDAEEIGAFDIAHAFAQMWEKKRYNELFFMIDTCQANTMYSRFYSPNILAVGSSKYDESSYSHHADVDVGVAVIDRFTYYNLEFLEQMDQTSNVTLQALFESYDPVVIHSEPGIRTDLFKRDLDKVKITDFLGSVQRVTVDTDEPQASILDNIKPAEVVIDKGFEGFPKLNLDDIPIKETLTTVSRIAIPLAAAYLTRRFQTKWSVDK